MAQVLGSASVVMPGRPKVLEPLSWQAVVGSKVAHDSAVIAWRLELARVVMKLYLAKRIACAVAAKWRRTVIMDW